MQAETPIKTAGGLAVAPVQSSRALVRVAKLAGAGLLCASAASFAYLVLPALSRAGSWAYAVAFLIQATSSSALVVPVPGFLILAVMAQDMNPLALAVAGGAGGALGELTGYWLGTQGRSPITRTRLGRMLHGQVERRGSRVVTTIALVPVVPMGGAGMLAGLARYPLPRFLATIFVGKTMVLLMTCLAARGLFSFMGWQLGG